MKSFILLCIFAMTLISGCANNKVVHEDDRIWQKPSQSFEVKDNQDWLPIIERLEIKQTLHLRENQDYDIFDYKDNNVLVLISDTSKLNPLDINDQVNTIFYERFVLLDVSTKTIKRELPIQKFGICTSALASFGGAVFSFFEVSTDRTLNSSICFINDSGMQYIYEGYFSPFGMGPVLQHYDDAVLFSYLDKEGRSFGVVKITENFETEDVLHFSAEDVDYISDDFKATKTSYAYTIGDSGKVTFCVGTSSGITNWISLPEGRKIHGFDVTSESLIVSLAADETDLNKPAGILAFDLITGDPILEQEDRSQPLYSISVNEYNQMCGFANSTLKFYILEDCVKKVTTDVPVVSGGFYKIISNEKNFLVATYGFNTCPEFWLVSSDDF